MKFSSLAEQAIRPRPLHAKHRTLDQQHFTISATFHVSSSQIQQLHPNSFKSTTLANLDSFLRVVTLRAEVSLLCGF